MEILSKEQDHSIDLGIIAFQCVHELQSQIEKQSQENEALKKQVDWFKQQYQLGKQRQFGKSSETSKTINLSLFDEKMVNDQSNQQDELINRETITYKRNKKS